MSNPYSTLFDRPLRGILAPVVWGRTYFNLLYLLIGFPLVPSYFVLYLIGLSIGVGLLVLGIGGGDPRLHGASGEAARAAGTGACRSPPRRGGPAGATATPAGRRAHDLAQGRLHERSDVEDAGLPARQIPARAGQLGRGGGRSLARCAKRWRSCPSVSSSTSWRPTSSTRRPGSGQHSPTSSGPLSRRERLLT